MLVRQLMERVASLVCLTTSRQRLGISGEQEFALLPLATPRTSGVRCWVLGAGSGKGGPDLVGPNTQHPTPNT